MYINYQFNPSSQFESMNALILINSSYCHLFVLNPTILINLSYHQSPIFVYDSEIKSI